MENKPIKLPEAILKEAFDLLDINKKGFLEEQDLPSFAKLLLDGKNLAENDILETIKKLKLNGKKFTFEDISLTWAKALQMQNSNDLDAPAVKLVTLLKQIKNMPVVKEKMKEEIGWSIDKITQGKVYETELDTTSPRNTWKTSTEVISPAMTQLAEMLPWLAQFSNPRMNAEDIEAYKRDKLIEVSPKMRPAKRKSILLEDLLKVSQDNKELMNTINTENFNIFELLKTFGRSKLLPIIAYNIFESNNVFSVLDEDKFEEFIVAIRNGYNQENPFHNDIHVADVLQMCHLILNQGGLKEIAQLDLVDVTAFLLSAIIHDYKHPGVTNGFLQNTHNDLALIYNDQSILENFHISESFRLILSKEKDCNVFNKLSAEKIKIIRKRIIGCILATDMARHFEIITSLQNLITTHDIREGKNAEKIVNNKTPLAEFESKQFILNACLHAADIGNPARIFPASEEWSNRVMGEFWRQGDLEKSYKLPVSYLCDRLAVNVPGSQVGFISGFTIPIFDKLSQILPRLTPLLKFAIKSEDEWKKRQQVLLSSK